ncbi:MAG: DNA polymerase III subunit gamma/tau [Pseudomonadota bacterium]
MSYQVLARKWRPRTFAEMVGQTHVLRVLINALDSGRIHHAYLFTGTRGVGKTTVARIFAKSLNCEKGVSSAPCNACSSCEEINSGRFVDLIEVDAASRTRVEDTRELLENVQYAPTRGRYKVYLIDEVHMLSASSFNALLKTLEEPPEHVKFLLATTDPQKLPITILSRCLQFNLKHLPVAQISGHLQHILTEENIEHDTVSLRLLGEAADGSMRDALSLLDQAIAYGGGQLNSDDVGAMLGALDRGSLFELLGALAAQDAAQLFEHINHLAEHNPDFDRILSNILSILQKVALMQIAPDAVAQDDLDREALEGLSQQISAEDVQLYYQIGLIGRRDLPLAPDPRGGFEMLMLRMLAFRPTARGSTQTLPQATTAAPAASPKPRPAANAASRPPPQAAAPEVAASPKDMPALEPANWVQIVKQLTVRGAAQQLADNCVLKEWNGRALTLQLAQKFPVTEKILNTLQKSLETAYGHPVQINITEAPAETPPDEAPVTPANVKAQEAAERQQNAIETIQNDPMVIEMQKTFGATIKKVEEN